MTKGTTSMGKRSKGKTHIICRRCGSHSFHASKRVCSSCGFGSSTKMRGYNWAKAK